MDEIELQTERLRLRRVRPTDAERLAFVADDIRVARNLTPKFPHPYTIEDAEAFIGSKPDGFAIELLQPTDPAAARLIGMIGGSTQQAEHEGVHGFGYWLGVAYWGWGYATEAGRAYLDHLVESALPGSLRRVEASVYGWNPGSGKVLSKLGLELEGRRPDRIVRFGQVTDELLYGKCLP